MISLQEYFKEYQHSFWNWREQTEVIALSDGSTLVYKAYLMRVLEGLSLGDTPPLDAVLMALAATKPQAKQAVKTIEQDILMLLYGGTEEHLEVPKGFDFLYVLQQLPDSYHQDRERLFLLQTIFTNCYKPFSKANMQQILEESKKMSNSSFEQLVAEDGTPINPNLLFRALHVLQLLAEQFPTVESLLEALNTAQDIEAPTLEEPSTPVNPHWREELVKELPTFYMASLLPALQAGIALPSLQRLQQQEAFGGTADLSNKGEFDRLLISEFAYDKRLFLSRLVNKEALYRQREASPERPVLTRHILIDISIYNWGTIKQIAYGIALALEKEEEEHISSYIYAIGEQVTSLNWNGVEMVAQQMGQVAPILHAAESLQAFFKKNKPSTQQEVILISSQEAVQHAAMQQVMRQHQARLHYWIAPSKEGKISIYQYHSGKKLLQEFLLSLNEIWHTDNLPTSKNGPVDPRLLAKKTPILVPEPKHYEQLLWATSLQGKEELFMLAPHGHVLRHYGDKSAPAKVQGWEWLYGGLVDYTLAEAGLHSSGDFILLVGMRSPSCLDLVNMSTQTQTSVQLPDKKKWYLQYLVYEQDVFYAIDNQKEAWIVEVQDKPVLKPFDDVKEVELLLKKHQLFLSHKKSLGRTERHYQILKNINTLSITEHGHLLINGRHQLKLTDKNIIKIGPRTSPTVVTARQNYKKKRQRHFTFPDGSTIMANSLGVMTLTSSNTSLPPIYLPMVLNKSLGMATEEHFCGNPYYYKNRGDKKNTLVTPHFFFTMYLKPYIDTILGSVTV